MALGVVGISTWIGTGVSADYIDYRDGYNLATTSFSTVATTNGECRSVPD